MANDVIKLLARYAPRLLPEYFNPDCCIAATAVAIDVLAAFNIPAIALPVKVMLFNRVFANIIREHGLISWEEATKIDPAAYSVGIGYTDNPHTGYDGHLVAMADNVMIDLSLTQMNRQKYGMVVTPFVSEIPRSFLDEEKQFMLESENGCVLVYNRSSNTKYLSSNDWLLKERRQQIVQRLIRRIRNH